MRYKVGMKVIDHHGNKFSIHRSYMRPTPVGDTLFFVLKPRKKSIQMMEGVTEWSHDTFFEVVE